MNQPLYPTPGYPNSKINHCIQCYPIIPTQTIKLTTPTISTPLKTPIKHSPHLHTTQFPPKTTTSKIAIKTNQPTIPSNPTPSKPTNELLHPTAIHKTTNKTFHLTLYHLKLPINHSTELQNTQTHQQSNRHSYHFYLPRKVQSSPAIDPPNQPTNGQINQEIGNQCIDKNSLTNKTKFVK